MMEKDTAIFEEAFDELEKEGYFKDLETKIKHLRSSTTVHPPNIHIPVGRSRVSKIKNRSKRSKMGSRVSKFKVKAHDDTDKNDN